MTALDAAPPAKHCCAAALATKPAQLIARTALADHIGRANILPNVQAALDRAREL